MLFLPMKRHSHGGSRNRLKSRAGAAFGSNYRLVRYAWLRARRHFRDRMIQVN